MEKTVLIQGFFTEGRIVQCDFLNVTYENGIEVARGDSNHTVVFAPDTDRDYMLRCVNADITSRLGWPAIEPDEWARAVGHCKVEHTPEVIAAYLARSV